MAEQTLEEKVAALEIKLELVEREFNILAETLSEWSEKVTKALATLGQPVS